MSVVMPPRCQFIYLFIYLFIIIYLCTGLPHSSCILELVTRREGNVQFTNESFRNVFHNQVIRLLMLVRVLRQQ